MNGRSSPRSRSMLQWLSPMVCCFPAPFSMRPKAGASTCTAACLPRWRGAAPIQRAVMAGDAETGVQVMKMEVGLDTGPVLMTARTPISPTDTAGDVHDRLSLLGAGLIVEALARIEDGSAKLIPQREDGVTYAAKITADETRIDWSRPATEVSAHLRGSFARPWRMVRMARRERCGAGQGAQRCR